VEAVRKPLEGRALGRPGRRCDREVVGRVHRVHRQVEGELPHGGSGGVGELGIADPGSTPGETVARALRRFQTRLRGTDALLVPWVQDFSFSTPYDLAKVQAQIDAGRRIGAKGFLLWNARGLYTKQALAPPPS